VKGMRVQIKEKWTLVLAENSAFKKELFFSNFLKENIGRFRSKLKGHSLYNVPNLPFY